MPVVVHVERTWWWQRGLAEQDEVLVRVKAVKPPPATRSILTYSARRREELCCECIRHF